ncbi:double-strand break repair protein AddB [Ferrovibrio terrae]|uniref:double-strand break repair protein AddB n=1 Tax=Ferrovibrio terrae TaxID=2594003 RepID=UPI0031381EFE
MTTPASPTVYTIAPGRPFLDLLARGILRQHGADPLQLSRVTVLLPTRRACRALAEAFLRQGDGKALLLPTIRPLGDVDEDELDLRGIGETGDDALPFGTLERSLLLARLVMASPLAGGDSANALRLARELGHLLDTAATEEVGLERLPDLVPAELAGHWQQTLDFLQVIRENWPAIKAEQGRSDSAEHRQRATQRWIEHWQTSPPGDPVIAAGSTGTIPATARLLKLIARLPQGSLVLPGLDRLLDDVAWSAAHDEPTHPQHALARLLDTLGILRAEVLDWPGDGTPNARSALLTAALLPPAETHRWRELRDDMAAGDALTGLQRIDAPGPREEALAIALAMRETLETPGRTAALITPDRMLARRVAAELARYDILVDDSAGQPLLQMAPAVFLRLLATAVAENFAPVALLALLKHPFCRLGMPREELLRWTRDVEIALLRKSRPLTGLAALAADLARTPKLLPPLARLSTIAQPLIDDTQATDLKTLLQVQVIAAEALTVAPDQPSPLWQHDAGEALHGLVVDLLAAADQFGTVTPAEWPRLLDALLEGQVVRPRRQLHPRLSIWGLLEARLQQADRIILGGLNEGTWPPQAKEDPWLSRPMRQALGLSAPEFRLGQTAHDFVQAASGSDVILTRAAKVDGTPTVPARWLLRLEALLENDARWKATAAPQYLAWAEQFDTPVHSLRVDPPRPSPPVAARPRRLPVTDIETWVRDPYAIYAKRILGLRRLDLPELPPDARLRGNVIHTVLEKFQERYRDALPDEATAIAELLDLGRTEFGGWLQRPDIAALWWPRFERAMRWFHSYERTRRTEGFRTVLLEQNGALEIAAPAGIFTLTATADRIDHNHAKNSLTILDYKTGRPPSEKEVNSGLAPQLALEAAIAQVGGFKDLPSKYIEALIYIRLTGGEEPGTANVIESKPNAREKIPPAEELAQQTLDRLKHWVGEFDKESIAYLSRPRPRFVKYPGDYDHLARVAERAEGSGEDT